MVKRVTPPAEAPKAPGGEVGNLPEAHIQVASTVGSSAKDVSALMQEIADLKQQLELSEQQRTEVEAAALAAAEAQGMLMQREIQEVITGKKRKVKRAKSYEVVGYKDDGREIRRPVWHEVELPTYFYKVDLPPVGGEGLAINGISLYHGTVYELDVDTLRSVKEMVYRSWDHDRNIHGSDENVYRQQKQPTLSMNNARGR